MRNTPRRWVPLGMDSWGFAGGGGDAPAPEDRPPDPDVPEAIRQAEAEHRAALAALMRARVVKAAPQLIEDAATRLALASRNLTRAISGGDHAS